MHNPSRSSHYSKLQPEDRVTIASLKQQNFRVRSIARQLLRSPATISRELVRNGLPSNCRASRRRAFACSTAGALAVYFCDLHSPWQRRSNENMNGLERQYLRKGTELSIYSQQSNSMQ